jgi:class 3 adenylate cyclase/tetratricopeptide (TPR) repeat protein
MAVKIAVVAGSARRFAVGNPRIQVLDVLAGSLLDRMSGVEALLERGEVGIAAEVLAWLGPEAEIALWRTAPTGEHFAIISSLTSTIPRTPWADSPILDPAVARPWLPPIIAERLARGEAAFIAELRLAIPIFLGFEGIDYDGDEAAGGKLDAYVNWVQTVLAHYGGHLLEITMGDKGSSLGMTFGAPVAHEDDAARAVAAAMEMRAPPAALSFIRNTRVGVTQGQLYVGACGSDTRRTYIGLGNEANIAARLKGHARPGQIVVSGRVASAAAGFDFRPLGPATLKGLHSPMPVFEVVGEPRGRVGRTVHGRRAPAMIGRADELALLSGQLRALQRGESSCIIIDGEAAIGKSRLVEELQARAQASGIFTLAGSGDAIERSTPYHAWRPVFRPLFDLREGDERSQAELQAHVLRQLEDDEYVVERAPLLNAVLPMQMADNELTAQMGGEVRAGNTRQVLVRVLQRALQLGSFKLLLIMEDAHWLDSASWALAAAVRNAVHPAIKLIVMRPLVGPTSAEFEEIRDEPDTIVIELGPLPAADIRLLVRRALDVRDLDHAALDLINRRAEGHPFFSQELAHALLEAGLIGIDHEGVCHLTTAATVGDSVGFPDTIQGVITSRIDHLPAELQSMLKVASAIGREFGLRILCDIYPAEVGRTELQARLTELERLDLVEEQSRQPDAIYRFKHIITQEVAYGLMLFAQRRELHRTIAGWYERVHAAEPTPYYGLLAHHLDLADEPQRAVGYLGLAGEQALVSFANHEAVRFLSRALDLAEGESTTVEDERVARWTLQLGEAYVGLSQYVDGLTQLERGLLLLSRRVPRASIARSLGMLGQATRQAAHRILPRRYVGRARHPRAMQRISRAWERLAEAAYVSEDTLLSFYASLAALNAAEAVGDSSELARAYVSTGVMLGFVSLHGPAERYIARAFETARHTQNSSALSHVSLGAGSYYLGVGNWARTEQALGQARALARRLGDVRGWEGATGNLGIAAFLQGDFTRALDLAEAVCESAIARGDVLFQAIALALKATCLCHLGQCSEGAECIDSLRRTVGDHPEVSSTSVRLLLHDVQLGLYLRRGDEEPLRDEVLRTEALLGDAPLFDAGNFSGYSNLAEASLVLWRAHPHDVDLRSVADRTCKHLRRYARFLPIGRPRSGVWSGHYAWIRGNTVKARRTWQRSLEQASELGMAYDEGLAHLGLARSLEHRHPDRTAHLNSAAAIFARLNASDALADVHAALEGQRA